MHATSQKTPTRTAEPTEAEIQHQAYHLWIEGGRLEGVELDNWHSARELLRHGRGRAPGAPVKSRAGHRLLETFN